MPTTKKDLTVFDGLAVVTLDGFEGEPRYAGDTDPLGSANCFCETYGMAAGEAGEGEGGPGILWTDYDLNGDWAFSVLIAADEVDALTGCAREAGYSVVSVEPIAEPTHYGDGHTGTVEILKHRDGWVVLS